MAKINVLDKSIAELIAAGEVVERPSSVIKELVENSIDSGASAITVEIQNGGRTFMRVTDNGCGIEKDDIKNAFLRHATSKIKNKDDLNAIFTLGFRGEALASICAVSKVELLTRTADNEFGFKYVIEGGNEIDFDEAGCALGTTFIIRDLFYNTPARMKFMKKDNTESNVVVSIIERIAVSHPEISFKVIRDGKQALNTPGDGLLKSAIFSVFGSDFSNSLINVDYELNGIQVDGFVTKPTASRKNRTMEFFFLNGRYIRSKTAMAALEQAYKNQIMSSTYPGCVLNLKLNPSEVDVNVHPSKIEVRFSDEQRIFQAVYYAVKSGLSSDVSRVQFKADVTKFTENNESKQLRIKIPDKSINNEKSFIYSKSVDSKKVIEKAPLEQNVPFSKVKEPVKNNDFTRQEPSFNVNIVSDSTSFDYTKKPIIEDTEVQEKTDVNIDIFVENDSKTIESTAEKEHIDFKYVGQLFETYILVEVNEKMIMIDKHAAHERILFEQIKKDISHSSQMLLIPIQVLLSSDEYDALITYADEINSLGFEIEDYGSKTILVRSVPMELDSQDVKDLIIEIAGKLTDKFTDFSPEFLDWLYHSVACRAAIKAGNKSTAQELIALADIALNDENIRYCPHGRPVTAEMSMYEIKKRFSRIV